MSTYTPRLKTQYRDEIVSDLWAESSNDICEEGHLKLQAAKGNADRS